MLVREATLSQHMGYAIHKFKSHAIRRLTRLFSSMVRGQLWGFRGRRMRHDQALIQLWVMETMYKVLYSDNKQFSSLNSEGCNRERGSDSWGIRALMETGRLRQYPLRLDIGKWLISLNDQQSDKAWTFHPSIQSLQMTPQFPGRMSVPCAMCLLN